GANGPPRLVSKQDFRKLVRSQTRCAVLAMIENDRFSLVAFAMLQRLSDTHDWDQPRIESSQRLLEHGLVRLAEILATLAMADNHVGTSHAANHGPGYFAGVCPFLRPEQVLRADSNAGALCGGDGRRKIRKGRADRDLAMLGALDQGPEFLKEAGGLGG